MKVLGTKAFFGSLGASHEALCSGVSGLSMVVTTIMCSAMSYEKSNVGGLFQVMTATFPLMSEIALLWSM